MVNNFFFQKHKKDNLKFILVEENVKSKTGPITNNFAEKIISEKKKRDLIKVLFIIFFFFSLMVVSVIFCFTLMEKKRYLIKNKFF